MSNYVLCIVLRCAIWYNVSEVITLYLKITKTKNSKQFYIGFSFHSILHNSYPHFISHSFYPSFLATCHYYCFHSLKSFSLNSSLKKPLANFSTMLCFRRYNQYLCDHNRTQCIYTKNQKGILCQYFSKQVA